MELRQLRYLVSLAEELHFGRAAAREHIVQSALSQQIRRMERELGVVLVERSTHYVRLTRPGESFVAEARLILAHVDRAMGAARNAPRSTGLLRVAVGDASLDSMPQVLRNLQFNHPDLAIHRAEASVPEQYRMLADGRLDVGIGRATHAPNDIASEVFRLDPLGLLLADDHPLARLAAVPVRRLVGEMLLLAEDSRAPEFNEFVFDLCRTAGFTPTLATGSVQSTRAAADLVCQDRCLVFTTRSCDLLVRGVRWLPVVDPTVLYPWSLLWRSGHETAVVEAVRESARALSEKLGWLLDLDLVAQGPAPAPIHRSVAIDHFL